MVCCIAVTLPRVPLIRELKVLFPDAPPSTISNGTWRKPSRVMLEHDSSTRCGVRPRQSRRPVSNATHKLHRDTLVLRGLRSKRMLEENTAMRRVAEYKEHAK